MNDVDDHFYFGEHPVIYEMPNPGLGLILNVHKLIFTDFHRVLSTCRQKQLTFSGCFLLHSLPFCQICVPQQKSVCHSHLYILDIFVPARYLMHISVNKKCPSKTQRSFVFVSNYTMWLNSDWNWQNCMLLWCSGGEKLAFLCYWRRSS